MNLRRGFLKRNGPMLLTALAISAFAWVLNSGHRLPSIAADEVGYIAVSRLLVGIRPLVDMSPAAYYPFGYSILLAPLNLIFHQPADFYRAGMVLNAILLFSSIVLLKKTLDHIYGVSQAHAWIAAVACLYPAYIQNVGILWTESAFLFTYTALIYVASRLTTRSNWKAAVALVFVSFYAYAVHQRALLLPVVSLALIGLLWRQKRLSIFTLVVCLLAAAVLAALISETNTFVFDELWGTGSWNPIASKFSTVFDAQGIRHIAIAAVGEMWYAGYASLGLVYYGCYHLLRIVWDVTRSGGSESTGARESHPCHAAFALFVLVATVSVFAASVFQMMSATRADHFVYGRYIEGVFAPLIAVGLVQLWHASARDRRIFFLAVAVFLIALATLSALIMPLGKQLGAVQFTVPALAILQPPLQLSSWLFRGTLAAGFFFVIGCWLASRKYRWMLAAVALIFAAEGIAAVTTFGDIVRAQEMETAGVRKVLPSLKPMPVFIDRALTPGSLYFFYQADLPQIKVRFLPDRPSLLPRDYYLIGRATEPNTKLAGGYEVLSEQSVPITLRYFGDPGNFFASHAPIGENLLAEPRFYLSNGLWHTEGRGTTARRWTAGTAEIIGRFPTSACFVELALSPAPKPPSHLTVTINGAVVLSDPAFARARMIKLRSGQVAGSYYDIGIRSDIFRSQKGNSRTLGVYISDYSYQVCP